MITYQALKELIAEHNNPELAKRPGMVRQIWQDGEITCQKSGELLWHRNLHCFVPGQYKFPAELMPIRDSNPAQGYAFITEASQGILLAAMAEYAAGLGKL